MARGFDVRQRRRDRVWGRRWQQRRDLSGPAVSYQFIRHRNVDEYATTVTDCYAAGDSVVRVAVAKYGTAVHYRRVR